MVATSSRVAFAGSLRLLARNPAIVVPGLVAGALSSVVTTLLEPADPLQSTIYTRLLQLVVQLLAAILSIAFTTGMADAAWSAGRAAFRDGARAFQRDAGHVFVAMLVLFAIAFVAAVLAAYTLSLSLLVLVFYCIYTMPAAVVGERPGFHAVGESIEIAFRRPRTTLLVVAGIGLIAFGMGALAELVHGVPFVGPLVAAIVIQAVIAYFTLVIVGEYRALRQPSR
jgi:hypothetical protein